MRFTKIPLIATLMAVALSLLIVLPALAQSQNYDDTRGQLKGGANLTVAVLSGDPDITTGDNPNAVDESVANSYFNGSLYVSNSGEALNAVRINATTAVVVKEFPGADGVLANRLDGDGNPADDLNTLAVNEAAYANDNFACDAVATVRNNNTGRSIKVYMNDADFNAVAGDTLPTTPQAMLATFEVIVSGDEKRDGTCASPLRNAGGGSSQRVDSDNDGDIDNSDAGATLTSPLAEVRGKIPAKHGDTLTVTVAGISGSVTLTVDANGPEFSEISPADNAYISSNTVKFRFVVTDNDSGLAHDGELDYSRGDNDARAYNSDGDSFTTSEPRSDDDGTSRDIQLDIGGDDKSGQGTSGWRIRGNRAGVSYFMDMAVTGVQAKEHKWFLQAKDRVGNTKRTKVSDKKKDFTLTVDISSPEFRDAFTGISYDASKKTEIVDRSSILVTFEDANGLDAVKDVDHTKFLVEDAEVVGAIRLADKADCGNTDKKEDAPLDIDGQCITQTPQARVYLQLAEDLAPDAEPLVSMFGGAALDNAGNPSNQDEVTARDNIAPGITVTLATTVGDRPVVRNNGEVAVSITSDEELRNLPTVWFAHVVDGGSDAENLKAKLGANRRGDRVRADAEANSWSRTYGNGAVGGADGLYAVIVIARDAADNLGSTPGWGHKRSDNQPVVNRSVKLADLEAAGLLVEIDTDLADPEFSLSPETGEGEKKTESSNPFVTVDFAGEKDEYGNYVYKAGSAPSGKETGDKISNFGDSHSAVQITSITLNGSDVMDHTAAVTSRKYTVGLRDLSTGNYELKVTGQDDAGNTVNASYKFEAQARAPYKLDLIPGWNLVSVPGTPLDSSVGAVMGNTGKATIVLAYQDDAWLTAVNDNGTWRGTLTDIVGGYGYWVQTTAFESIRTLIPETDTSSTLPTADVIEGWNLLGVVDVKQAKAGDEPSGGGDPDDYFGNIAWKVAYSFDTDDNTWSKSIPDTKAKDEKGINNGKGYWVWSTAAGTLVP